MKILLLGEYSNVHNTLAQNLRALGNDVTHISNGDFWKGYDSDILLVRHRGALGAARYVARLATLLPKMRGYDIVQVINPMFLELKAERIAPVWRYLKKHNRRTVLGAFGMDAFYVKTCVEEKAFRYSDFNIGEQLRDDASAQKNKTDWTNTPKARLNERMAEECDGIVAGLYEYWRSYTPEFDDKLTFIPYPIDVPATANTDVANPVHILCGINASRHQEKGTDRLLEVAQQVCNALHDRANIEIVENIPFKEYCSKLQQTDILLDQLYSYTPAMNALQAMALGTVCVTGGEPENYSILNEERLRPIVNPQPENLQDFAQELQNLILNPSLIKAKKQEGIEYIAKHHDAKLIAKRYLTFYKQLLNKK